MKDFMDQKHIDEIPLPFRDIFSNFVCFNRVQSEVLDDILYSDESLVISAPTGSGKTVLFELGVVKLLMQHGIHNFQSFKIIYISPIKSLCQERLVDWDKKFSPFGINCICVTGDSDNIDFQHLTNHNLIISTPEKWDSLTRKWKDNESLVKVVKLFMIDEVHLLNEDDRGSTLEVIVSRMKIVQNFISRHQTSIRFMAVSATIGNIDDIAKWIGCNKFYQFPEEMRPVQLKTMVLGYNCQNAASPFKFDLSLNYRLQSLIIQHSDGQPTLIFCNTRKSVEMTAKHLVQTLKIQITPAQSQKLQQIANSIRDIKIRDVIKHGVGVHHAGVNVESRHIVETAFRDGHLPILIATSTLAMGVNLPAHLVIIKSTKFYNNGAYQDYSATAIHQMIGRAGRPQFDTSATALILTTIEDKKKIEKKLSTNEPVESNLHRHLTEHLNAEVVLGTITGLDVAMQWLASTFLYIRATKNPRHYGLPLICRQEQLDKKLLEMFQIDLNKLMRFGMITIDENINVNPTMIGRLMARYYVDFETMKLFTQITGTEVFIQILALLSKCQEFSEMRLRVNDKKTLNLLNRNSKKQTIRFPLNGKIKTWDMKVNCIIQAILGNLEIADVSIQTESCAILRNGQRIMKCLIEYLGMRKINCYNALLNSIILGKCLTAKLWENSPYVSKQLNGIGSILATQLVNAGKDSFQKILDSNPREIELIIKRKPPFGNYLLEEVRYIPNFSLNLENCQQGLKLTITLVNANDLQLKCTLKQSSLMCLIVGNNFNEILLYEKYQISYTIENPVLIKLVPIKSINNLEFVEAHFISEDWVGIDQCCEVIFENENSYINDGEKLNKENNSPPKQTSYIQTFLDIYMKIKKPDKQSATSNKKSNEVVKNNNKSKNSKENKSEQIKIVNNQQIKPGNTKITNFYEQNLNTNTDSVETKNIDLSETNSENPSHLIQYKNNEIIDLEKEMVELSDTFFNNIEFEENFEKIDEEEKLKILDEGNSEKIDEKVDEEKLEKLDEEIVYSSDLIQNYEEIVSCTNGIQNYDEVNDVNYIEEENLNEIIQDEENVVEENQLESIKEDHVVQKEIQKVEENKNLATIINPVNPSESDNIANNSIDDKDLITVKENESNVEEDTKIVNKIEFSSLSKARLFSISQKYLTDVDSEDTSLNRHSINTCNIGKKGTLRNILNRGKKKRKLDDINPAEDLQDLMTREEQERNKFLDEFKKPEKKKMNHNYNEMFCDSTINNQPYRISELLDSESERQMIKNSNYYLQNKKNIKWRSPLIFSPGKKYSPKGNYKRENSEGESQRERYDAIDKLLTPKSSNINNKPYKRSKYDQKTFKSLPSTTQFALSDKDYEQSPSARKSKEMDNIEKYSDICSTQILESLASKDKKKATSKILNQNPQSAVEYYSQLFPRNKNKSMKKDEIKEDLNRTQSSGITDNKENYENTNKIEMESNHQKKSFHHADLNSSRIIYELPQQENDRESLPSPDLFSQSLNLPQATSRSEEYINAKIRENYPIYPDFESVAGSSRYLSPSQHGRREFIEYDPRSCLTDSFGGANLPKSMHYSSYVDPVQYDFPAYGNQYIRPSCCDFSDDFNRRKLSHGYMGNEMGTPVAAYRPSLEPRCTNYHNALSQQMTPYQRSIPHEDYLEKRQLIPNINPPPRLVYPNRIEPDLNSSFVVREPSYPVNYQPPCPGFVDYYPRTSQSYGFPTQQPPEFVPIDKDYVMNKYWGSIHNQE